MILTCLGPIEQTEFDHVFYFESMLFDRGSPGMLSDRLTLENRFEFVKSPEKYLDNVTGNLDMFEFELKSLLQSGSDLSKTLICMHENDLLLNGSKEFIAEFKKIVTRYRVHIVLSISLLKSDSPEEYLVSHIHYGSTHGLFFGALLMRPGENFEIYLSAQAKTGAPLFCSHISSPVSNHGVVVIADHVASSGIYTLSCTGLDLKLFTSKCRFKTDFKKYGGQGIDIFPQSNVHLKSAPLVFQFNWDPPKLDVAPEDVGRWICDICGVSAELSERENYTKLGYTYCSTICLGVHRKRNWEVIPIRELT